MNAESPRLTIHMVGHGHIDDRWLWDRPEAHAEAWATFGSALDRMREDPDFKFTASTALFYKRVKEMDPDMFKDIKKRVDQGRWNIAGGRWVESDSNVPSGESLIRQHLYAQRFFYDNFGRIATTGFEPDDFGHSAEIPKIASHAGIENYLFQRPEKNEMGLPHETFWWQASDGSRLLTKRISDYNATPDEMIEHFNGTILDHAGDSKHAMMLFGVGNHGGGPTKENIRIIRHLQETSGHNVIFSTPDAFFKAVRDENLPLPTVRGELQPHAVGCYSVGAEIKQNNRRAEVTLLSAEKLRSAVESITCLPNPTSKLREQGEKIAGNQFHDTIGATLPRDILEKANNEYIGAIETTSDLAESALLSLAAKINIEQEEKTTPILIANPHAWKSRRPIEIEVQSLKPGATLVDADGNTIPFQELQSVTQTNGRNRITFISDLPSLGYNVYRLKNSENETSQPEKMKATDTAIENDRFKLTIDERTGTIAGITDKETNIQFFKGLSEIHAVLDDPSDTWAHGVYRFDKKIGQFEALQSPKLVEHGEVKSTIRVKSGYYGNPESDQPTSTRTQDFTMYKDLDLIRVDVTLDWHEKQKLLKRMYPINFDKREVTSEIPYGTISRAENGTEVPGLSYVDVSGVQWPSRKHMGISIINDSTYSYDAHNNVLSITELRSPVHAHHDPRKLDPEKDYEYMDQGQRKFSYWLVPHEGTWREADIPKIAAECNQQPLTLVTSGNERGKLPQQLSFAEVESDNVMMTVIKRAEDPSVDAYVVRLHETTNKTTTTDIRIGDRVEQVTMKPNSLKSLIVPFDSKAPVFETDAMEISRVAFE